jgi:hypothetical protein
MAAVADAMFIESDESTGIGDRANRSVFRALTEFLRCLAVSADDSRGGIDFAPDGFIDG